MKKRIPNKVFVSYSRKDNQWLEILCAQLAPLINSKQIEIWYDKGEIEPGDLYNQSIANAIDTSGSAIILMSANFQASEFINANELPRLRKAADSGDLTLFWIPVGDCVLGDDFAEIYHTIGDPKQPLNDMSQGQVDVVFASVARKIKQIIIKLEEQQRNEEKMRLEEEKKKEQEEKRRAKIKEQEEKRRSKKDKKRQEKAGGVLNNMSFLKKEAVIVTIIGAFITTIIAIIPGFILLGKLQRKVDSLEQISVLTSKEEIEKVIRHEIMYLHEALNKKYNTSIIDAARTACYSALTGNNDHSLILIPLPNNIVDLDSACHSSINPGWHAGGVAKGQAFNQDCENPLDNKLYGGGYTSYVTEKYFEGNRSNFANCNRESLFICCSPQFPN